MHQTSEKALALARRLTATLPVGLPGLFNPWGDVCSMDITGNDPAAKLLRLAAHLDCEPDFILCGEAPGYAGARHSGIAFTSERLLCAGRIPRVPSQGRLTSRRLPFSEQSATIIWDALYQLGVAERTVLWNALQLHPHPIAKSHSNRTPSPSEVAMGRPAMLVLRETFPRARLIAVGRTAQRLLTAMNVEVFAAIRHPANGGAREFREGIGRAVNQEEMAAPT